MLSILIPLFNYDPFFLIAELIKQAEKLDIDYEVVVLDDASDKEYEKIYREKLSGNKLKLIHNKLNLGRAQSRNYLGEISKYDNLLFIDCDSSILSDNFLKAYISQLDDYEVICGGTAYQEIPPVEAFLLRWKYGQKRETLSANIRTKFPSRSFSSFNFMIKKELFIKIGFDKSIIEYGHEDTIFGIQLRNNKINIKHIDNPIIHNGLENSEIFISKSLCAINNLYSLYFNHSLAAELANNVKIIKWYNRIRISGFRLVFSFAYNVFGKAIEKNLGGPNPILFLFDLYKLFYLCSLK